MKRFVKIINNVSQSNDGWRDAEEAVEIIPVDNVLKVFRYIDGTPAAVIAAVFTDPMRSGLTCTFFEKVPIALFEARLREIMDQLGCP